MGLKASISKKDFNDIDKAVDAIEAAAGRMSSGASGGKDATLIVAKVDKIKLILDELRNEFN